MMSLSYIRELNLERATEACANCEEPVELTEHDMIALREHGALRSRRQIPHLGDYEPLGFERVNLFEHPAFADAKGITSGDGSSEIDDEHGTFFVDSSGWGDPGEPALTLEQFSREAVPGFFYAVTSAGQFQVCIGVFERM